MKPTTRKNTTMIAIGVFLVILLSLPIPWAAPLIVAGLVILLPLFAVAGKMVNRGGVERRFEEVNRDRMSTAERSGPIHSDGRRITEEPDQDRREAG